MLTELLTNYGPIAGIWFDGIIMPYVCPDSYKEVSQVYALIRKLQPQCLISFKTGWTGEEDFLAPEWHFCEYGTTGLPSLNPKVFGPMVKRQPQLQALWDNTLRHKPVEICTALSGWFYREDIKSKSADTVLKEYEFTRKVRANYLLNVAPIGDGSIAAHDEQILREVGRRLKQMEGTSAKQESK
jgi:alpha-L-fucosidase